MTFKVVRGADGNVLASGPDVPEFDPVVPVGAVLHIEEQMPPLPGPSKEQRIAALLAPVGLTQAWQVDGFIAGMVGGAATQGITADQLILVNPAYAQALSIRTQILAIMGEP